jgi:hypothetical protein
MLMIFDDAILHDDVETHKISSGMLLHVLVNLCNRLHFYQKKI